ncbi:hypothetical protein ABBQ32_012421 [Trebouxia sp. C0010 RCD-2024]
MAPPQEKKISVRNQRRATVKFQTRELKRAAKAAALHSNNDTRVDAAILEEDRNHNEAHTKHLARGPGAVGSRHLAAPQRHKAKKSKASLTQELQVQQQRSTLSAAQPDNSTAWPQPCEKSEGRCGARTDVSSGKKKHKRSRASAHDSAPTAGAEDNMCVAAVPKRHKRDLLITAGAVPGSSLQAADGPDQHAKVQADTTVRTKRSKKRSRESRAQARAQARQARQAQAGQPQAGEPEARQALDASSMLPGASWMLPDEDQVQTAPLFSGTPPPQQFQPAAPATATPAQSIAVDYMEADAVTPDSAFPVQSACQVASSFNTARLEGTTDGAPLARPEHEEAQQAEDGSVQETLTPQTEQAAGMICEVKPDETANVRKSLVGPITLNPAAPPDQDTERLPSSANTKVAVVTAAPNTEAVDASVEPQLASQTGMEEAALTRGSLAGASEASSHADLEDLAIAMSHTAEAWMADAAMEQPEDTQEQAEKPVEGQLAVTTLRCITPAFASSDQDRQALPSPGWYWCGRNHCSSSSASQRLRCGSDLLDSGYHGSSSGTSKWRSRCHGSTTGTT